MGEVLEEFRPWKVGKNQEQPPDLPEECVQIAEGCEKEYEDIGKKCEQKLVEGLEKCEQNWLDAGCPAAWKLGRKQGQITSIPDECVQIAEGCQDRGRELLAKCGQDGEELGEQCEQDWFDQGCPSPVPEECVKIAERCAEQEEELTAGFSQATEQNLAEYLQKWEDLGCPVALKLVTKLGQPPDLPAECIELANQYRDVQEALNAEFEQKLSDSKTQCEQDWLDQGCPDFNTMQK